MAEADNAPTTGTPGTPSQPEGAPETPATTTTGDPNSGSSAPPPTADIAAMKQELAASRAETDQVKRYLVQLVSQLQAAQTAPDPDGPDPKDALRTQLQDDPETAISKVFEQRMGPLLRDQYAQQGTLAKDRAKQIAHERGWGDEWDSLQPEVEKFMGDVPLDRHLSPDTWLHAFRLQLAADESRFDEVAIKRADKKRAAERAVASEGASPGRIGPRGPAPLTDAEKRMADAFGMSHDDYQKHKTEMLLEQQRAAEEAR